MVTDHRCYGSIPARFVAHAPHGKPLILGRGSLYLSAPVGSEEWRAETIARLAAQTKAISRRCRANSRRPPRQSTNTAGGIPPRRPSD